jgi:bZIP transcription factor
MTSCDDKTPAAAARKRRIELRNQQRSGCISDGDGGSGAESKRPRVQETDVDTVTSDPKPSITGIKLQHRYDPGVKMSRDELKAWRKEARRVRNRESAAASRERNRERITELEGEVAILNSKYAAALQRIIQLEAAASNDSFTPAILRQDLLDIGSSGIVRACSPFLADPKTVSPPLSPSSTISSISHLDLCAEESTQKYHHIIEQISRPAVSI